MGVQMSARISQLTGSTLYVPAAATFLTSSRLGKICIVIPPICNSVFAAEADFGREKTKTPLTEITFCQGRIKSIRGATLIHGKGRALSRIPTYPRQLTYALTLQNTQRRACAFDCTLRGPFDGLCFARLSASRALCTSITTVISASTVCCI